MVFDESSAKELTVKVLRHLEKANSNLLEFKKAKNELYGCEKQKLVKDKTRLKAVDDARSQIERAEESIRELVGGLK